MEQPRQLTVTQATNNPRGGVHLDEVLRQKITASAHYELSGVSIAQRIQ